MKIKLPFAQRLLAIGLLIVVAFFVYQTNLIPAETEPANGTNPILAEQIVVNDGVASDSGFTAKELLAESSSRLLNSQAIRTAARLTVNLFEDEIVAVGEYSQLGQGTGFAKLALDVGSGEDQTKIVQICNRGVYYRFQSTMDEPSLQIADLRRIAETDSFDLLASQNAWMTTGGLSSLLENLVKNFDFEPVMETHIGTTPVYKLRGRWNEDRLKRFLFGQVKHVAIKDGVNWQELPVHLPQYCEILMGNDDYFPLFPYRITFLKRPFAEDTKPLDPIAIVSLDLYEVEKNAILQAADFDVNFDGTPPDDLTKKMVDRIEVLNQIQRSALKSRPSNQTR